MIDFGDILCSLKECFAQIPGFRLQPGGYKTPIPPWGKGGKASFWLNCLFAIYVQSMRKKAGVKNCRP